MLKLCQIVDILIDSDSPKSKWPEKAKTISTGLHLASELPEPSSEMALLTKIAQYNRDSIEDSAAEKKLYNEVLIFSWSFRLGTTYFSQEILRIQQNEAMKLGSQVFVQSKGGCE